MSSKDQKTILLVEDQGSVAEVEAKRLEKCGYNVIIANTGTRAVEIIDKTDDIDLILMDIELGSGSDGIETAEIIMKGHTVPVVFLSSYTDPEVIGKTEKTTSYGFVLKKSNIAVLDVSIKMALKLFEENKKTETVNAKLEATLDALPDLLFEVGLDGYIYDFHSPHVELLYKPSEDIIGKRISDIHPSAVARIVMSAIREANEKGFSVGKQFEMNVPAGTCWFEISVACKASAHDKPHFVILKRDITRHKQLEVKLLTINEEYATINEELQATTEELQIQNARLKNTEETLRVSEDKFRTVADFTYDWEYWEGQDSRIAYISPSCERISGYTAEEFLSDSSLITRIVHPDDLKIYDDHIHEVYQREHILNTAEIDFRIVKKDGSMAHIGHLCRPVFDEHNNYRGRRISNRDISKRKLAEQKSNDLLAEKEIILKEVHHRIKNNMNTIASLLTLQAGNLKEPIAVKALEDSISRIKSMELLYDKLYRSPNVATISVREYLPVLVDEIVANFLNSQIVKVEVNIEEFVLDTKRLQPLGIIINELLTNIMKYAFIGRNDGLIKVSATLLDGHVTFIIQDNGNGMPEAINIENSTGFGLMLVRILTEQLNGKIRLEKEKGTRFVLEFGL